MASGRSLLLVGLLATGVRLPAASQEAPIESTVIRWRDLPPLEPPADPRPKVPGPMKEIRTRHRLGMLGSGKMTQAASRYLSAGALPAAVGTTASTPTVLASFEAAIDDFSSNPPDSMGAVGPEHLVVTLNGKVRIQSKLGVETSATSLNAFWAAVATAGTTGDPSVFYDEDSGRYLMSSVSGSSPGSSQILLAVSQTADPTGAWILRAVTVDTRALTFADYPVLGFNQKWIAITASMYTGAPLFDQPKMWVFDKSAALAPGPVTPTVFWDHFSDVGDGEGGPLIPAITYGSEPDLHIVEYSGPVGETSRVALRAGYKSITASELGALSGLTAGVGLELGSLGLDLAFQPLGALGRVYRLGLTKRF